MELACLPETLQDKKTTTAWQPALLADGSQELRGPIAIPIVVPGRVHKAALWVLVAKRSRPLRGWTLFELSLVYLSRLVVEHRRSQMTPLLWRFSINRSLGRPVVCDLDEGYRRLPQLAALEKTYSSHLFEQLILLLG